MEREGPLSPKHHVPIMEQEAPSIFKEQFVPPELSIWDYFIAKVIQILLAVIEKWLLKPFILEFKL